MDRYSKRKRLKGAKCMSRKREKGLQETTRIKREGTRLEETKLYLLGKEQEQRCRETEERNKKPVGVD